MRGESYDFLFCRIQRYNDDMMKKLIAVLWVLAAGLLCLPVHAEENAQVYFSYTGTHGIEDVNNVYYEAQGNDTAHVTAWKNDTVYLKAAVYSEETAEVTVSDCTLTGDNDEIPAEYFSIGYLEKTSASLGTGESVYYAPHMDIPEIITNKTVFSVSAYNTEYVWIEIEIPENVKTGDYEGTLYITVGKEKYPLKIQLEVLNIVLKDEDTLSLDLWQYPYSSLRYYEILEGKDAFSEEHLDVLKEELEIYHDLGGDAITVSVINEPWGHQTYDDYPSMITWHKSDDGYMWFDYTDFDAWVELCMDCGIDERIESFSILPWDSAVTLVLDDGSSVRYPLTAGTQEWADVWTTFLTDYMYHLKDKGWFEKTYIFVDERDIHVVEQAVNVIEGVVDEEGSGFHIGMAINSIPSDLDFFDRIDYVSISIGAVPENSVELTEFLTHRTEKKLETTMYNCSTTFPNAFAISDPDESVWFIEYLAANGFSGYLRWALDAWTEDPLNSLDYQYFEAGDTLLVYPDEKDSSDPSPRYSVRLKMIEQGFRNVRKIQQLEEEAPEGESKEELLNAYYNIRRSYGNYNGYGSMTAANTGASLLITEEVVNLQALIDQTAVELSAEKKEQPFIKYACE